MSTTYAIHHTNGLTWHHTTWEHTWAALVAVYGDEIHAVDPHGWPCDGDTAPDLSAGRVLVWSDEADSENDDGARAVASVNEAG